MMEQIKEWAKTATLEEIRVSETIGGDSRSSLG